MNSSNYSSPRKLIDYTKQRGNQHLCAKNKVWTTTTKSFPSYERYSCEGIPLMVTISESSMSTTDTDYGCASENADDTNGFRQVTNDLRGERCHHKRQSMSSLETAYTDPARVETIDFFLKVPIGRTRRQKRSDLRERFRCHSLNKCSILQSILSENSTTRRASRRLPRSSASASFCTI